MTRKPPASQQLFAAADHDHQGCVDAAVAAAAEICAGRNARLTRLRRRVLELVWGSHGPVGAYDILERLGRDGRRVAPPTVYRALEFLVDQGLVHRIESHNAYVGCPDPGKSHVGQFLICRACGAAAELDDGRIHAAVVRSARDVGFRVQHQTIEVMGLCPYCQARRADAPDDG